MRSWDRASLEIHRLIWDHDLADFDLWVTHVRYHFLEVESTITHHSSTFLQIPQDLIEKQWGDNVWTDVKNVMEGAVGNWLDVILIWFETKVDEAWPQVRHIQQFMTRVNRSRKAAKYNSLSPDIKLNIYLFRLLRPPKLKEQMIRKAGKDKDAFETTWMIKQWQEYYTGTITSPAVLARPMQQPGLMSNKSMSRKSNQNSNTNNKSKGVNKVAPQKDKKKEKERTEKEKSKECNHCSKIHSGKCWTLNPKSRWFIKEGV